MTRRRTLRRSDKIRRSKKLKKSRKLKKKNRRSQNKNLRGGADREDDTDTFSVTSEMRTANRARTQTREAREDQGLPVAGAAAAEAAQDDDVIQERHDDPTLPIVEKLKGIVRIMHSDKLEAARVMNYKLAEENFICPISHSFMREPVVIESGQTFEKEEIEQWFANARRDGREPTCPMTNMNVQNISFPNAKINSLTVEFVTNYPEHKLSMEYKLAVVTARLATAEARLTLEPLHGERFIQSGR